MTIADPGVPGRESAVTRATVVVLPGRVPPAGLQVCGRILPDPGAGQMLIAVEASGIAFAEQAMRRGRYYGQPAFPFVPGYDVVGHVTAIGSGVDPALVGRRVAALIKTGGWASHVVVPARDFALVPDGLDPAVVETMVVNGLTAWQMLHRKARVRTGQTILVLGANGGVGTALVQLARHHGVRVIGTAAARHHQSLRVLGVEPVDYRDPGLEARVRELAPDGVDAVFDHVGGPGLRSSYRLLARRGTLVSYAIASSLDDTGSIMVPFVTHLARLYSWNLLPDGRRATFYDVWSGHKLRHSAFQHRLQHDLGEVFALLADGALTGQVAARFALSEAAAAMELAESRTVYGKVILQP